ncbi:MAG TPA: 3-hydroxyacyl-ACP dehydratase FabZ [Holophagaceae bacterium]|nr:3-hydroxyacyl-ACP dehydratase FabZ [Holophagaceae bacterium]
MTDAIQAHLPHRHPFLLVDRVLEREPGVRVVAEKLVSYGDPILQGHFEGRPLVPGVLMIEMLAQAGGFLEAGSLEGKAIFLAGVQDARFKAPAFPGDRLRLEVRSEGSFAGMMKVAGTVTCEGRTLCTAQLMVKKVGP